MMADDDGSRGLTALMNGVLTEIDGEATRATSGGSAMLTMTFLMSFSLFGRLTVKTAWITLYEVL